MWQTQERSKDAQGNVCMLNEFTGLEVWWYRGVKIITYEII